MADTFYFSRDTKVHLTDSAGAIYKIPVEKKLFQYSTIREQREIIN